MGYFFNIATVGNTMTNKIPSVQSLIFDIYSIYHTKNVKTRSKLKKELIKIYRLPDNIPHLNTWNYIYNANQPFDEVSTDLIYDTIDFFYDFFKYFDFLNDRYNKKYTLQSFDINFFRKKNKYYTNYLINQAFNIINECNSTPKITYLQYINYKYKEMSKLFGTCNERYPLDPFFKALKEDLFKIINFNVLNPTQSITTEQLELLENELVKEVIVERVVEKIVEVEKIIEVEKQVFIDIDPIQPKLDIRDELLQQLKQLDPTQFEKFSLYLIATITKEKDDNIKNLIIHNGKVGDGGVDGILKVRTTLNAYDTYLIQCKRYDKTSIGSQEMHSFVGAMVSKKANKGIFITTSHFTKNAIEVIENIDIFTIQTMDGQQLVDYMLEHKIGIKEEIRQDVDKDFFNSFSLD